VATEAAAEDPRLPQLRRESIANADRIAAVIMIADLSLAAHESRAVSFGPS
jgi:hypothetical protein